MEKAVEIDYVPTSLRLPKALLRRLKLAAVNGDTSQQAIVIAAVEEWLDRAEKPAPKTPRRPRA